MKRCVLLFVIFQALDILTTIVGIKYLNMIEMNGLIEYMDLPTLIFVKVAIVPIVVIIMISRPYIKFHNIVWIVSAFYPIWNIINMAVEISL